MYQYILSSNACYIFDTHNNYLGKVWTDNTEAWSVTYANDVKYLPINTALKKLGCFPFEPIFTFGKLNRGQVFEFYADLGVEYEKDDLLNVWAERENNGLGEKIIYGKGRVIEVPRNPSGIYKAIMLG